MHILISDFKLGPEDFLKVLPLGYGPSGLYYHPEKPVWLITRAMHSYSQQNYQTQEIHQEIHGEKALWIYTDDPQMVVLAEFTLPIHPLEYK